MIDINELRLIVQDYRLAGSPVFIQATDMDEILDRLEAAEKVRDWNAERLEDAIEELKALRAKIEAMEQQEPVGKFIQHPSHGMWEQDGYGDNPDAKPIYALPGAQAQPALSVPEGWKLVPIKPTEEMINKVIYERLDALMSGRDHSILDIYHAMIEVAPEVKSCI